MTYRRQKEKDDDTDQYIQEMDTYIQKFPQKIELHKAAIKDMLSEWPYSDYNYTARLPDVDTVYNQYNQNKEYLLQRPYKLHLQRQLQADLFATLTEPEIYVVAENIQWLIADNFLQDPLLQDFTINETNWTKILKHHKLNKKQANTQVDDQKITNTIDKILQYMGYDTSEKLIMWVQSDPENLDFKPGDQLKLSL